MNMKQRFRNFVSNTPVMLERRKYMAQYAGRYEDETPLPKSVNNFLNMIPSQYRPSVLKWIMTEGMRKASTARRFITDQYNKKYGLNLRQNQIFSSRFYEDNPQFMKLKDQIERDWFDHDLEPRYIRLRGNAQVGAKMIDIHQINAHLEEMGLEPMFFGGMNGLSQHIEKGSWATDQIHADSDLDQQGHDLSLAPGDVGLYSTAGKDIEKLKEKIRDAKARGDSVEFNRLVDEINKLKADSEEDGGKNLVKLGLGRVGYIPSIDDKNYAGPIGKSARDSRNVIHRLYKDISENPNIEYDDLDGEELAYIQKLQRAGKISPVRSKMSLRQALGVIKRQLPAEDLSIDDPQDVMYAKAIVKSVFLDLLSRDPSNPGDDYEPWPKTNPALGKDSTGLLQDATISIVGNTGSKYDHKGHDLHLTGPNTPTPQNIDHLADILTDWFVDDETGLTSNMVTINRGKVPTTTGAFVTYPPVKIQNEDFLALKGKTNKPSVALAKLGDNPIAVNFNGQRTEVKPQAALAKLNKDSIEQTSYNLDGQYVDPSDSETLVPISPEQLPAVLKGYRLIHTSRDNVLTYRNETTNEKKKIKVTTGKNGVKKYEEFKPKVDLVQIAPDQLKSDLKGYKLIGTNRYKNVLTYQIPNTNIRKKIKITRDETGKIVKCEEYKPNDQNVDQEIKNPNNHVEEFGGGKYARITLQDGSKMLARRSVSQDGGDTWHKVNPTKSGPNDQPLLSPIKVNVNAGGGLQGVKPQIVYDDEKTHAMWNHYISNPEEYGEVKQKGTLPQAVLKAVSANKKNAKGEDVSAMAATELMNQIANPCFKFGDFLHKDQTPRGQKQRNFDVYDLLGKTLSPEEIKQVIPIIKHILFGDAGHAKHKRDLTQHDGGKDDRLFVAPNSVRSDIYQSLIENGYMWRVRKAGGVTRSENKKNKGEMAFGAGGDDDEAPSYDRADPLSKGKDTDWEAFSKTQQDDEYDARQDDDEYDDELYSADDQDDILRDRGEDQLDPSLSKLNIVPTAGANSLNLGREASPQGVKRDITGIYASKLGQDDESRPFWPGRRRQGRFELAGIPQKEDDLEAAAKSPVAAPAPAAAQVSHDDDDLEVAASAHHHSHDDDDLEAAASAMQMPTPTTARPTTAINPPPKVPHPPRRSVHDEMDSLLDHTNLKGYKQWLSENEAIHDTKVKIKDGCGFNWWGAAGDPLGVSISGKADSSKSDPTGKGKVGKSRTPRK